MPPTLQPHSLPNPAEDGRDGPQSQPKLQAILRMKLNGPPAPLVQGR